MTKRDLLLLRLMRTAFMVAVALLFLTLPFRLPDNNRPSWLANAIFICTGVMLLYVEGTLWLRRTETTEQYRD